MSYVANTQPIKDFCEYHKLTLRQFLKLAFVSFEDFIDFLDGRPTNDTIDNLRSVLGNNAKIMKAE